MLGYGQQAGGTHPTGMHSCLNFQHYEKWFNKNAPIFTPKSKYLSQFTFPSKNASTDTLHKEESAIKSMSDPIHRFLLRKIPGIR